MESLRERHEETLSLVHSESHERFATMPPPPTMQLPSAPPHPAPTAPAVLLNTLVP